MILNQTYYKLSPTKIPILMEKVFGRRPTTRGQTFRCCSVGLSYDRRSGNSIDARTQTNPGSNRSLWPFRFLFVVGFNYVGFRTRYSRLQIQAVFDLKDRYDIQLLQTETAAFEVCRQFLDIRGTRGGACLGWYPRYLRMTCSNVV
jgi:hypothetical protein